MIEATSIARAPLLCCLLAAMLGCSEAREAPPQAAAPVPRPNLLLIVSDTLRADVLDCYGGRARTPRICGLAERGVIFERAYSNAPWTLPSSVALFSGSFPSTHAVEKSVENVENRQDFFYVADQEALLSDALFEDGYEVVSFLENVLAARPNTMQSFEQREGDTRRLPLRKGLIPELDGRDRRYRQMRGVLQFLALVGERRFFALQWFRDPHAAYVPPRDRRGEVAFDSSQVSHPFRHYIGLGHRDEPDMGYQKLRDFKDDFTPYEVELLRRLYAKEVEFVDERVGFILDLLQERGLGDDTIVVFTSDHGEGFGEHGLFLHGNSFYDELVHVPLIMAGPGLPRGRRIAGPVSHVDLMPTLCDLMKADCQGDPQGRSFESLLRQGGDDARERVVYLENPTSVLEHRDALVDAQWKLIALRGGGFELYDRSSDPGELLDVVAEHPEVVARMQATLEHTRRENAVRRERNRVLTKLEVLDRAGYETQEQLKALGYIE